MTIDVSLRSVLEKLALVAILALCKHGYSLYHDMQELIAMKDDLKAVQQYLLTTEGGCDERTD